MVRTRLSLKTHVLATMSISLVALLATCLELHKSVIGESLLAGLVVWALLTIYFTVMLHCGLHVDQGVVKWSIPDAALGNVSDGMNSLSLPPGDLSTLEVGEGILGVILGAIAAIVFAFFLLILIWVGVNVAIWSFFLVFIPAYYIFRRGIRMTLVHSRRCAGNYLRSFITASVYSFGYSLLFGGVVFSAEFLVRNFIL